MPHHEIDFANGHLFCSMSQEGDENDMSETFEVFQRMEKYYDSYCVVKHSVPGGVAESRMKTRDAVWQIKEGWLEDAVFVPEG